MGRIDVGGDPEQNPLVTVNRTRQLRVSGAVKIPNGLLAMLGVLLLAGPAWAGEKSWTPPPSVGAPNNAVTWRPTTNVMPASSSFVVATQPFAASSSVANPLAALTPTVPTVPNHPHRRRPITIIAAPVAPAPQTIVVQQPIYYPVPVMAAASECVAPGYWSYRWVPYTTTQNIWVPGSWAADGSWIDSHYEPRPYSSGYYEPLWTPGC